MSLAATAAISSQAAIALVNNKGDIRQAAQSLANGKTIQSLLISTVAGGITGGLAHNLGISLNPLEAGGFSDHLQREALKAGVHMSFDLAQGQNPGEALAMGLRYGVAGTIGGLISSEIGLAYQGDNPIDPATHKLLHALAGAGTGMIISDDIEKGALAGAIGAFAAETFAEMINTDAIAQKVLQKANAQKIDPSNKEAISNLAYEELKGILSLPVLGAAITNLLSGQDVKIGIFTATNAVENNSKGKIIAEALNLVQKFGKPILKYGEKALEKSKNLISNLKNTPHPRLPKDMPKGTWKPSREALDKVKPELGVGKPVNKGQGFKWQNKHGQDSIRINKGNPLEKNPSQQVDYVKITRNGQTIGRDGKKIEGYANPSEAPDAHIPLSEWIKWKNWGHP